MDNRALRELQQLATRDTWLAARAGRLRRLDGQVAAIRAGAEAADAFLAAYPEEEGRRLSERAAAEQDLAGRRRELREAEDALTRATDAEARAHAKAAQDRAVDHVAVAQARLDRAEAAVEEIRHDAARIPVELTELRERAGAVPEIGPPQENASLLEWASHAHAELFVASRQIDAQRERVIREANELASMLLGEPTYGATVAQALARAEAQLL